MGVMLALDGQRPARGRRRGQHERTSQEQAYVDAFAAFLRYDGSGVERCLSRLTTTVLAARLRPAARALADAVDVMLAGDLPSDGVVELNFTVSAACLIGRCRTAGSGWCDSLACEHECHRRQQALGRDRGRPAV